VSKFRPGDRVFGVTLFNAYATNINVPENQIFNIPENLSLQDAGGLPVIYLTAYFALYLTVHIFPESVILVHSAAGGVGSALLQLCKINGWRSIGVVGDISKAEAAEKMGAGHVIVKSRENIWEMVERYYPEGVDVILDGNGTSTLKEGLDHLGPTGKMISYGFHSVFSKGGKTNPVKLLYNYLRIPKFNPISPKNLNKSIATFNLSYLFGRNDILQKSMRELLKLIEGNKIMMPQVTVYPFDKVADAHRDLQSGNTIGKLVLHNKIP
jgi:NADPH:quinone reductase-like Zn-dependent oxidoreductase